MRIAKLSLLAFGPFTNGELGFSPKKGVLDLVYGPNEAGKSTTLRALIALLYGIPARTGDAHLHEMSRMRVGATLVDHDGRTLTIIRRKGNRQTLLGPDDAPMPEHALTALLGGLDETMFRHMFGLDHERLREGAEALLRGGGHLGESLFDAGTGARAIRSVLEELKAEADELFKARGTTTKLQVAVRQLRERQRARKEAMLSPQVFVEQKRALAEAREQLARNLDARQELLRERSRLSRALTVLPLLSRRDLLLAERRELGPTIPFHEDDAALHTKLEADLLAEERECARLRSEVASLGEALAALPPVPTERLEHELLRELEQRFGSYRKSEAELPQKRGELESVEADIALLRERLGSAVCALHKLDKPAEVRLRKLGDLERATSQLAQTLAEELMLAERDQAALEEELRALAPNDDALALEALLTRAEQDPEAQALPRLEAALAQRTTAIETAIAKLGMTLAAYDLARLPLPSEDELERLDRALEALDRDAAELDEREAELARKRQELAGARTLLLAEGDVVTEDTLARARAERETCFAKLLEALKAAGPAESALERFREAERKADEVADRLRREAARTHALVRIELDEAAVRNAEAELQRERERVTHALTSQRSARTALLTPLGLERETAATARLKLKKLESLAERAAERDELASDLRAAQSHVAELTRALTRALGETSSALSFPEALARARARVQAHNAMAARRETLAARCADLRARVRELTLKRERAEHALAEHRKQFQDELRALGFRETLSVDEVLASLDDLTTLSAKERAATSLRHTVSAIEQENARFVADLRALCAAHVPEVVEAHVAEAMARVAEVHQAAHDAARERTRVENDLTRAREELRAREHTLRGLCEERDRLFARAGVTSFDALREQLERAKRGLDLDAKLSGLDERLAEASEGMSLEELQAHVRAIDPDSARARLEALEVELETLNDDIDQRHQEIGRLAAGLEQLKGESGAVSLAEEAEADLSQVAALARRYAELKLGYALLSREVERYRLEHQGPVLERASALFPRLTHNRYQRLSVELDDKDQPVLACVRADGKHVRVEGLSDGTRDQLYLALRVASIERYLDANPPMPLVLDDAFVHFDDARASAALTVLGELCQRTQVIFFTHHARMVELAKKALGAPKVLLHELDPVRGVVRTRDDGPLFARV